MRAERVLQQKTNLSIKIQSHFRRLLALKRVKHLREHNAALKLQRMMKGYLGRKNALAKRDNRCKIIFI